MIGTAAALAASMLLALAPGPVLAAEAPQKGPSELLFIAQITALLLVSRLLGEAMLRLKQPAVMGQLIAGLLLGPSLLGALFPDVQHALFPAAKEQKAMLDALSQFGILMLLLLTGMETDLKLARQTGGASISCFAGRDRHPVYLRRGSGRMSPRTRCCPIRASG